MDKNELINFIEDGKSIREIAEASSKSYTSVRYWLNKYQLKTQHKPWNKSSSDKTKNKVCKCCGNEFFTDRNRSRCNSCNTKIRRYRTKIAAVKLLGEKCNRCGWSGNYAAFEFHHFSNDKEFNISRYSNKSWKALKSEIEKCELLCSNCHRIEHSKYDDEHFMEEVYSYSGNLSIE